MKATKLHLRLAEALKTIQNQQLELDKLHEAANLQAQQLELTERELLDVTKNFDFVSIQAMAADTQRIFWQDETKRLQGELNTLVFEPPRKKARSSGRLESELERRRFAPGDSPRREKVRA